MRLTIDGSMMTTQDGAAAPPSGSVRIGVIGAGRRGQGNFLPALTCLHAEFSITWVHSRTRERLRNVASCWNVEPAEWLDDDALHRVDAVAVSVPIEQNIPVLKMLEPHASRLTVVIDTPITQSLRDALTCARLLAKFKSVLVTEDYMNFPEFELARRAVAGSLIGPVSHINLNGLGYRYHGVALLRSFADFAPVRSARRRSPAGADTTVHYRFRGGLSGCVIGPYRRDSGDFRVEGENGTITAFPGDQPPAAGQGASAHMMQFNRVDGVLSSVSLESETSRHEIPLPEISVLMGLPFADKSEINLKRSWGLMQVFKSLREDNLNRRYGFKNALYDSLISRAADKLPLLFDPTTYAGTNAFELMVV
jgi:NADP oxidoreductase coenzyme F420-dependent